MDTNLLKEIQYLTRLIEQHKQKLPINSVQRVSPDQAVTSSKLEISSNIIPKAHFSRRVFSQQNTSDSGTTRSTASVRVHVNPNFKPQNPVIHINPKVCMKPKVHINPKLMKDVGTNSEETEIAPSSNDSNTELAFKPDIKRSVYVNPKLMTKISKANKDNAKPVEKTQKVSVSMTTPVCTRLKLVRGSNTLKTPARKQQNSSVIILSKRKLVRVRRNSKGSIMSSSELCKMQKALNSPFKKTKISPVRMIKNLKVVSGVEQSMNKATNVVMVRNVKSIVNKYRIDRTATQTLKRKPGNSGEPKRAMNKEMELITIGGIVYKSSKNQLVRRSYGTKRKKATSNKNEKFIVATNGKKLCRLKTTKETEKSNASTASGKTNGTRLATTSSLKSNHKTYISNKVKQRSIQILRNKMSKNNQPCLIYQRFGYCANHKKGTCPKLHDKKQVSLCKKFLQGNCLLDDCPLSHDVGPEKMPTCKYFLEGCCVRDSCPYRHVKVSSKTRICIEFLQGYCVKGHECTRRHEYLCPEFEKAEKCSKGKYCPYPHKLHTTTIKHNTKSLKRKPEVKRVRITHNVEEATSSMTENRLRYYQQSKTFIQNFDEKRDSIMNKIQIMKRVHGTLDISSADINESSTNGNSASTQEIHNTGTESVQNTGVEIKCTRRPPLGVLPAYIPIN